MTKENEDDSVLDLSALSGDLDITFESVEEDTHYKYTEQLEQLTKEVETEKKRSQTLMKLITPFLNKLKEDADKPVIKWPSRVTDVEEFQEKLNTIMKD